MSTMDDLKTAGKITTVAATLFLTVLEILDSGGNTEIEKEDSDR